MSAAAEPRELNPRLAQGLRDSKHFSDVWVTLQSPNLGERRGFFPDDKACRKICSGFLSIIALLGTSKQFQVSQCHLGTSLSFLDMKNSFMVYPIYIQ